VYRVVQFWKALTACVRPGELEAVAPLLGVKGVALFQCLSRNDRRHSLNVYATLRQWGYEDQGLLVAALLHDAGKTAGSIWLPYRVAVTLLEAFRPEWLARLGDAGGRGLLRPFWIAREHPEIGAQLLADAGFSATTVELVRCHHRAPGEGGIPDRLSAWLDALQRADGIN